MYDPVIVEELLPNALDWSIKEREFLLPGLFAIEEYANTYNVVALRLKTNKKIELEDYSYELYTENPINTARDIINILNKLGYKEVKFEIYLPNYEVRIHIEGYKQFIILYNNLYPTYKSANYVSKLPGIMEIFPTVKDKGKFTDKKLNYFSWGISLLYKLQKLYNPEEYDNWDELLIDTKNIYNEFIKEDPIKYISGSGDLPKIKLSKIKDMINDKFRFGVGANYSIVYIGTYMNKIQLITNSKMDKTELLYFDIITNIKKLYPHDSIIIKEQYPRIPGDFRLRRYTFYLEDKDSKYAFLDVFNSAEYELIPTCKKQSKKGTIYTCANVVIKAKFRLIDYLSINLLSLNKDKFEMNSTILYDKINKYFKKITDDTFNIRNEQKPDTYVGVIYDQTIYKKQQMLLMKKIK